MAILVRERELREEVARLTRENTRLGDRTAMLEQAHAGCANLSARVHALTLENTRLWSEVERMSAALADAASLLEAARILAASNGNTASERAFTKAVPHFKAAAVPQVPRPASDKPATPQPAPDVQTALAKRDAWKPIVDAAVTWKAAGPDPDDMNAATAAMMRAVETYLRGLLAAARREAGRLP